MTDAKVMFDKLIETHDPQRISFPVTWAIANLYHARGRRGDLSAVPMP
jgi:hypothetical protein